MSPWCVPTKNMLTSVWIHWFFFRVSSAIPSRIKQTRRLGIKFRTFSNFFFRFRHERMPLNVKCYTSQRWTSAPATRTRFNAYFQNLFCIHTEHTEHGKEEKNNRQKVFVCVRARTSLERGLPRRDNRLLQSFFWLSDEYDLHIGCDADIIYFVSSISSLSVSRLFVSCSLVRTFGCCVVVRMRNDFRMGGSRCGATARDQQKQQNQPIIKFQVFHFHKCIALSAVVLHVLFRQAWTKFKINCRSDLRCAAVCLACRRMPIWEYCEIKAFFNCYRIIIIIRLMRLYARPQSVKSISQLLHHHPVRSYLIFFHILFPHPSQCQIFKTHVDSMRVRYSQMTIDSIFHLSAGLGLCRGRGRV